MKAQVLGKQALNKDTIEVSTHMVVITVASKLTKIFMNIIQRIIMKRPVLIRISRMLKLIGRRGGNNTRVIKSLIERPTIPKVIRELLVNQVIRTITVIGTGMLEVIRKNMKKIKGDKMLVDKGTKNSMMILKIQNFTKIISKGSKQSSKRLGICMKNGKNKGRLTKRKRNINLLSLALVVLSTQTIERKWWIF